MLKSGLTKIAKYSKGVSAFELRNPVLYLLSTKVLTLVYFIIWTKISDGYQMVEDMKTSLKISRLAKPIVNSPYVEPLRDCLLIYISTFV